MIVAFVGAISNIHVVCQKAHWLAWICNLPPEVVGIISVGNLYSKGLECAKRSVGCSASRFVGCSHDVASYCVASPRQIRRHPSKDRCRIVFDDSVFHLSSRRKRVVIVLLLYLNHTSTLSLS